MIKLGGLIDGNNNKKQPSKSALKYSPYTIRDTPSPTQVAIEVRTLDLPDDEEDGIYESKIAGITMRCTEADKGIFKGVIYNESNNPYNKKAMAIVSMNQKMLGYIPNDDLDEYYEWSNGKPVTCVGFINTFVTSEGNQRLYGKVFAIKPCNTNFVQTMTSALIEDIQSSEDLQNSRV